MPSGRGNSGGGNSSGGNSGKGNSSGGNSAKGEIQIKLDSEPEQEGMQPSISGEISVGVASADWSSETAELSVAFDVGFGRGGLVIDTNTGEIIEQTAGFSLAGFFDYDVTELRCEKILTVRFKFLTGLIGWSYTEREFLKDKPGCELPEPEPDPEPTPNPGDPPPPLPGLDDDLFGYFVLGWTSSGSSAGMVYATYGHYYEKTNYHYVSYSSGEETENGNVVGMKYGTSESSSYLQSTGGSGNSSSSVQASIRFAPPPTTEGWQQVPGGSMFYYDSVNNFFGSISTTSYWRKYESSNTISNVPVRVFYAYWRDIKAFIIGYANQPYGGGTHSGWGYSYDDYAISGSQYYRLLYYPGKVTQKPNQKPPLPPTPPQIDMDDCCKNTLKLLKEIHKALGVKRLLKQGFVVPNRLMMPRTSGTSTAKNFLEIAEIQLRVTDNLGIHPFDVIIKDIDPTKKGDQRFEEQINSGSYALKEILQYLIDANSDVDANTNLAVRSAFLQTQLMTTLASQNQKIDAIIDGLGIGTKQSQEKVLVPFNPGVNNKAQGFDPKKAKIIDNNSEISTEALLPDLLQSKELPYSTEKFVGKHDIMEMLYIIHLNTSKQ